MYIIKKGRPAPEDGVLFNDRAHAEEEARKLVTKEKNKNELQFRLQMQENRLKFTTATTAIALESLKKQKKETDKMKDDRIEFLEKQLVEADKKGDDSTLLFVAGVGAGILVMLGASLTLHFATK